jgi:hypothetical protein
MFRTCNARLYVPVLLLVLGAGPASAAETELVNGVPQQLKGSVGVTFWMSKHAYPPLIAGNQEYKVLPADKEQLLLAGARVEAPPGFQVGQDALGVRLEDTSDSYTVGHTQTTIKYQRHLISGTWTVRAPEDCAEGEYTIKIVFPAAALVRDSLGAGMPDGEIAIVFRVKTYTTAQGRSLERWGGNFLSGLGCLLAMTVCVTLVGCCVWALFYVRSFHAILLGIMVAVPAWYSSLGFFGCMGQALIDLSGLHPGYAIAAGLGVNVAYFGLFWLVSGFGGWNRIWTICLGLGVLLLVLVTAAVFVLPPELPYVGEGRQFVPFAMPAILPGLTVAWLASWAKSASGSQVPAAGRLPDPQAEEDLAQVSEYLRRLPSRER